MRGAIARIGRSLREGKTMSFEKLKELFILNFVEKQRWKYLVEGLGNTMLITLFAVLLGVAFAAICLVIFTGAVPYAQARVDMWQNPFADAKGEGWQTVQSLYAISSGGLFGVGFGNSRQKFMYIAEPQNDFIFAVVCEELGLIGASVIILIFAVFIWRGFAISIANPDRF